MLNRKNCQHCGQPYEAQHERDLATRKLHRAKEILGSMHADLLPQHQKFWEELESIFNSQHLPDKHVPGEES